MSMVRRVRQFCRALTARLSAEDVAYAARWLPEEDAAALFYGMAEADRVHALRVAHTAVALYAATNAKGANTDAANDASLRFLVRCALLHDVGRANGTLSTFGKSLCVLLNATFPQWARAQGSSPPPAEQHRSGLSAMLYVYYHHAVIGAEKLRAAGFDAEAAVIACHHDAPRADDDALLCILRSADEQN